MARITIKRDGLTLVGEREEPFGEVYNMAILMHGFTANKNTPLLIAPWVFPFKASSFNCAAGASKTTFLITSG